MRNADQVDSPQLGPQPAEETGPGTSPSDPFSLYVLSRSQSITPVHLNHLSIIFWPTEEGLSLTTHYIDIIVVARNTRSYLLDLYPCPRLRNEGTGNL